MTGPAVAPAEPTPVVLRLLRRGTWTFVRVDYAALYCDDLVEIAGQQLSAVSGGPVASVWVTVDVRELPQLVVGTVDTWVPPAGYPAP
ncbi:hypothetical protein ACFFMR_18785 [Micromonospora andamanensis]|uniref:Uncharacterized protein n=1 Tax=Micromonospora andamanensis TaxID=1287068 RepID=A0ABQ4HYH5_9ACTN|nr:hypothetical protein [Micromonospora andamanensis]GIJ10713.1 hypothetical protein Van01_39270 [Micromonospora andamanensis]